jgi:hypothetical protein
VPLVPVPPQSWPSCMPQFAGPPGDDVAHVPRVCPAAVLQMPVQQLAPLAHESPGCPQKDDGWHAPFAHSIEQQSALPPHWLPSVLHPPLLRDTHIPLVQVWLQQSPLPVQGFPSDVQAG